MPLRLWSIVTEAKRDSPVLPMSVILGPRWLTSPLIL
jgi:hypothetical protein